MTDHRDTDAPFGPDEADAIIAAIHSDGELTCPRCKGPLVKGTPASATGSMFTVYLVRCPTCRRAVFAGEYFKRRT